MLNILLVDDSATDVRIMTEALAGTQVPSRLHVVRDGVEAMAFLGRTGTFANAPRPGLILLDLNMPRKNGLEVLADIKADRSLRGIPTVMLTSSAEERDVARAYDLHVNGYVQKPLDFDDFVTIMGSIEHFWTGVARLPVEPVAAGPIQAI